MNNFDNIPDDAILNIERNGEVLNYTKTEFIELMREQNACVSSAGVIYTQNKKGIIPEILENWYSDRKKYQKIMKEFHASGDKEKAEFYDKRQYVQKILLNSLYGVLGLPSFRFYDVDNAESVTISGQDIIKFTGKVINQKINEELNINIDNVIYIDTDSNYFSLLKYIQSENFTEDAEIKVYCKSKTQEFVDHINNFYTYLAQNFFYSSNNCIRTSAENVSKRAIWLAKKMYALNVVYDMTLNKDIDKLKVKGLASVRSSFPLKFRELLNRVLTDMLKNVPYEEIDTYILEFENSLETFTVDEICRTSSVRGITKYLKLAGKHRLLGKFAPSTPVHVKAAINYNDLTKKIGTSYEEISDGEKIQWVYLKKNPYRLETLALRGYNDDPEVVNFVEKYIDRPVIYESELKTKLIKLYSAIGRNFPASNRNIVNLFF